MKGIDYIEKLFPRLNDIKDDELKKKVASVWLEAWEASRYEKIEDLSQWEAEREKINISNVDHTNQVVECGLAVADVVERTQNISVDRDVLIAASILHDVDKILMFDPSNGESTPEGRYLPHSGLGSGMVLNAGLPLAVAHAIAAHSPNYSAVKPKTPEAVIVAGADHLVTTVWNVSRNVEISFAIRH